jgi:hypothetical protein
MSCLFDSLAVYLCTSGDHVRTVICDYLASNPTLVDDLDTHSLMEGEHPDYVAWMRNSATWGGAMEIRAACDIWNVVIRVHSTRATDNRQGMEFVPLKQTDTAQTGRVIDLYWNGAHYSV